MSKEIKDLKKSNASIATGNENASYQIYLIKKDNDLGNQLEGERHGTCDLHSHANDI